jgi:hypothetical protein
MTVRVDWPAGYSHAWSTHKPGSACVQFNVGSHEYYLTAGQAHKLAEELERDAKKASACVALYGPE